MTQSDYLDKDGHTIGISLSFTAGSSDGVTGLSSAWYDSNVRDGQTIIGGVTYTVQGHIAAILISGGLWLIFWVLLFLL